MPTQEIVMPTQYKRTSHIRSAGQIYPRGFQLTKTQQLPNVSTHQLLNSPTYKPTNSKLTSSSTHKLKNSRTYKLISSSTQNPSTQNLKSLSFILQYSSNFRSILAKIQGTKQVNHPYFQLFSLFVLSIFRRRTCILHHFAFLDWSPTRIFLLPNTPFQTLKTHFLTAILPLLAIYLVVLEGYIYTIAAYVYAYRPTFSGKKHCIQHQNTLHFVPKRAAFCTKTHVILHQNAPLLAANNPKSGVNDAFFK